MAYPTPKIVYDPGTGAVEVNPTYPNVQKPYADNFEATRHDSITNSGLRQSVLERIDTIRPVIFETVPWADLPMWQAFFAYALQGGAFDYYPDNASTAHASWQLVDDKVSFSFVCIGISKLQMNMRSVPA
jgi:hypothetical protein